MEKTIVINISGVIFHIEEDAYENLTSYMNDVKLHFSTYQDNVEIVGDIENRIAEMLSELLQNHNRSIVTSIDIDDIILRMGSSKDFDIEDASDTEFKQEKFEKSKKLYRDIDNRIIGGVCSGLGHYFSAEARWVRVAFFVFTILFGVGILFYLIFWMLMPKAITRTQKMEMKGEKINIQAFQKNIEKELIAVKQSIHQASDLVKPGANRLLIFINEFLYFIRKVIRFFIKTILKIIGLLFILAGLLFFIAGFIFLLVFLGYVGSTDINTIFPLNAIRDSIKPIIFICSYLIVFIPVLLIVLSLLKFYLRKAVINRNHIYLLFKIWGIALAIGIFCVAQNATDFKEKANFKESVNLKISNNKSYYLIAGEERTIANRNINLDKGSTIIITADDRDFDNPRNVEIELKTSNNKIPYLIKTFSARGKNFDQALNNAHQIEYFFNQKDSILTFDTQSSLKNKSLWRNQTVKIRLDIPINSVLYIENKLANIFFRNVLNECIDDYPNESKFIKVKVTQIGFVCDKSIDVIRKQEQHNLENNISEPIDKEITFN